MRGFNLIGGDKEKTPVPPQKKQAKEKKERAKAIQKPSPPPVRERATPTTPEQIRTSRGRKKVEVALLVVLVLVLIGVASKYLLNRTTPLQTENIKKAKLYLEKQTLRLKQGTRTSEKASKVIAEAPGAPEKQKTPPSPSKKVPSTEQSKPVLKVGSQESEVGNQRNVTKTPTKPVQKIGKKTKEIIPATIKPTATTKTKPKTSPRTTHQAPRITLTPYQAGTHTPVEPTYEGQLTPSPAEEEFRKPTIFYFVLVYRSTDKSELINTAHNLNLDTLDPEILTKYDGDHIFYWLTVGHYTSENKAYNMMQFIRSKGYAAEIMSEKVYH